MKNVFYIITLALIITLVIPQASFYNAAAKSKPENPTNKNQTAQNVQLIKLKNQVKNLVKKIKASNDPNEKLALQEKLKLLKQQIQNIASGITKTVTVSTQPKSPTTAQSGTNTNISQPTVKDTTPTAATTNETSNASPPVLNIDSSKNPQKPDKPTPQNTQQQDQNNKTNTTNPVLSDQEIDKQKRGNEQAKINQLTWETYHPSINIPANNPSPTQVPIGNNNILETISNSAVKITTSNGLPINVEIKSLSLESIPSPIDSSSRAYILADIKPASIYPTQDSYTITISLSDNLIKNASNLRFLHYENGQWVDITTNVGLINKTITGKCSYFSPFAVVGSLQIINVTITSPAHSSSVSLPFTASGVCNIFDCTSPPPDAISGSLICGSQTFTGTTTPVCNNNQWGWTSSFNGTISGNNNCFLTFIVRDGNDTGGTGIPITVSNAITTPDETPTTTETQSTTTTETTASLNTETTTTSDTTTTPELTTEPALHTPTVVEDTPCSSYCRANMYPSPGGFPIVQSSECQSPNTIYDGPIFCCCFPPPPPPCGDTLPQCNGTCPSTQRCQLSRPPWRDWNSDGSYCHCVPNDCTPITSSLASLNGGLKSITVYELTTTSPPSYVLGPTGGTFTTSYSIYNPLETYNVSLTDNGSHILIECSVNDGWTPASGIAGNNIDAVKLDFNNGSTVYASEVINSTPGPDAQPSDGGKQNAVGEPDGAYTILGNGMSSITLGFCGLGGSSLSNSTETQSNTITDKDLDGDGIPNIYDNCIFIVNPEQKDGDGDDIGDDCDTCLTCPTKGDSIPKNSAIDSYPVQYITYDPSGNYASGLKLNQGCGYKSSWQGTSNPTGIVCHGNLNAFCDCDHDYVLDPSDNCPTVLNADQKDTDSDGVGDACDSSPPTETCGNGIVESPEQCDDGNTTDDDGCSSTCQIETPLTGENECTKDLELIVQAGDDPPENVLTPENIQEISGCPFQSLQIVPENIIRTTVIDNAGCDEPCPGNTKELIKNYYQGDSSAGSQLCALDPTTFKNCLISNFEDEVRTEQATTFLDTHERDRLYFKWPKWRDLETAPYGESRSDGVTVYASSRQMQNSHATIPLRFTLIEEEGFAPFVTWRQVTYDIGNEIIMIMPDPAIALMDLATGNVWPDYYNTVNRRTAGTFPYSLKCRVPGKLLAESMPYYHASFNSFYTAGLSYNVTSVANNSLDLAHNTLVTNWNTFIDKYRFPAFPTPSQTPIKSPWEPNGSFAMLGVNANVERYALLISPSQEDSRDLYFFNAGVDLIKHLLVTYYSVQEGNIFTAGTEDEITNRISAIQGRARTAKANNKTTQLLIYVTGHGVVPGGELLIDGEPPIADIMTKEGGGALSVVLINTGNPVTDTVLSEANFKNKLNFELQYESTNPTINAQYNVIDDAFVIFETCMAGAAVI